MSKHDDLLQQGPREAPEPETAEQRTKRLGGAAAGGIAAGGLALGKLGFLAKFLIWIFAWHGVVDLLRIGGWVVLVRVAGAVGTCFVMRARRGGLFPSRRASGSPCPAGRSACPRRCPACV